MENLDHQERLARYAEARKKLKKGPHSRTDHSPTASERANQDRLHKQRLRRAGPKQIYQRVMIEHNNALDPNALAQFKSQNAVEYIHVGPADGVVQQRIKAGDPMPLPTDPPETRTYLYKPPETLAEREAWRASQKQPHWAGIVFLLALATFGFVGLLGLLALARYLGPGA